MELGALLELLQFLAQLPGLLAHSLKRRSQQRGEKFGHVGAGAGSAAQSQQAPENLPAVVFGGKPAEGVRPGGRAEARPARRFEQEANRRSQARGIPGTIGQTCVAIHHIFTRTARRGINNRFAQQHPFESHAPKSFAP